jgi:hypothetical protein
MSGNLAWLDDAAASFADVASAEANLTAARAKLDDLRRLEVTERQEREELRELEDEDEALRQLDGDAAAPLNRRRAKRLAQLDKSVPARGAALRLQQDRIRTAEGELKVAQAALAVPILQMIAQMQTEAAKAIREGLVSLAAPMTKLLATDHIRVSLLGPQFTLPEGCSPPIGGTQIVRSLTSAVPDRLRPPELADRLLFEASEALSGDIIAQIKGQ